MIPVLRTDRLLLREHRLSDAPALFEQERDPLVMRYRITPVLTELSQAEARIAYFARLADSLMWAIALRDTDVVIGNAQLYEISHTHQRAMIGYSLATAYQGQGFAREAVARVISHAFDDLGLRRLGADIDPSNAASQKLIRSFGFELEGTLRAYWRISGVAGDACIFGLLKP